MNDYRKEKCTSMSWTNPTTLRTNEELHTQIKNILPTRYRLIVQVTLLIKIQSCDVSIIWFRRRLWLYAMKGNRSEVPQISCGIRNMIIMSQVKTISLTWTNNKFP